ncbi:hypothetical protein [Streptomyces sp. NPDC057616]|uniref:hypothetical protein n=1 Tax=Streptomyces sp. NPDC057616 TaxID=3346183 RepID=UPI00367CE0F8
MGTREWGRASTTAAVNTDTDTDTDTGSDAAATAARLVGASTRPCAGPALTGEY